MKTDQILRIESAAELAVPPERTLSLGRWRAHLSRGMVRRLNSVALHGERPSGEETQDRLEQVVAVFQHAGLRPRIRQTTLDDWLDEHLNGWAETGETVVMVRATNTDHSFESGATSVGSIEDWLAWIQPLSEQSERFVEAAESARRLTSDNVVVFAQQDEKPVGAGRAVASDDLVGVYDLTVTDAYQRQGHGNALTRSLLLWAVDRSPEVYLQVEAVNQPAMNLYRSLGFAELYRYRYRSPARSGS